MEKQQVGNAVIYTDRHSNAIEALVTPTGSVKINGTIGEFKAESIAALLQIVPAIYGKVFGLSLDGLKAVADKYDFGGATEFAKGILHGDERSFKRLMADLIDDGWVWTAFDDDVKIYFPSQKYLEAAGLISPVVL